jgi:hypothetical protein
VVLTVNENEVPTVAVAEVALLNVGDNPATMVSDWVALPTLLVAVIWDVQVHASPMVVPEMVAVPSWLSTSDIPNGSVPPVLAILGMGYPATVIRTVAAVPKTTDVDAELVNTGASSTEIVSTWMLLPSALKTISSTGNDPALVGVPEMVPVPSPLSVNSIPEGSGLVVLMAAVGYPAVVIENEPVSPRTNVAVVALVNVGGWSIVNVMIRFALPTVLLALSLTENDPVVPVGVPVMVAVPLPLFTNDSPAGKVPDWDMPGVGYPAVDIGNVNVVPVTMSADGGLMMAGAWSTVTVMVWVVLPAVLTAISPTEYDPPVVGVPEMVPVPSRLSVNDNPAGSWLVVLMAAVGDPVVVTETESAVPAVSVVSAALVNSGAWSTVIIRSWTALPAVSVAVNVTGQVPSEPAAGVPDTIAVPSPLSANDSPEGNVPDWEISETG